MTSLVHHIMKHSSNRKELKLLYISQYNITSFEVGYIAFNPRLSKLIVGSSFPVILTQNILLPYPGVGVE